MDRLPEPHQVEQPRICFEKLSDDDDIATLQEKIVGREEYLISLLESAQNTSGIVLSHSTFEQESSSKVASFFMYIDDERPSTYEPDHLGVIKYIKKTTVHKSGDKVRKSTPIQEYSAIFYPSSNTVIAKTWGETLDEIIAAASDPELNPELVETYEASSQE